MLNKKLIEVLITGVCLSVYVGSEEYVSELKDKSLLNERYSDSHSSHGNPVKGSQDVYSNPIFYEPFPHNHELHSSPEHRRYNNEHDHPDVFKSLVYPQDSSETNTQDSRRTISDEVPLEIAKQIDNLGMNEFLANYVEGYENDETPSFAVRFEDEELERSAAIPAKAKCSVENTTIEVAASDDPTVFYMPKCTKIERCSGCCSHKKLACLAIKSEDVFVEVYKLKWKVPNQKFNYISKEVIPIERHIQCSCECKTRPEDCLPYQKYHKSNCECACTNTDEELKCVRDSRKKYWDPVSCSCKCLEYRECFTGSNFDQNECVCKTAPKRRNVKIERHENSVENLQIQPLDEEN